MKKYILFLFIIFFIAIGLRIAIGEPCRVSSESMSPTIQSGDWLWIDKTTFGGKLPSCWADIPLINIFTWIPVLKNADNGTSWGDHRISGKRNPMINDVIVFQSIEEKGVLVVKRVCLQLLAGDCLELNLQNRHEYKSIIKHEKNVHGNRSYKNKNQTETLDLSENYFFVLGDNPQNSRDSRHYGYIPQSAVVGKAAVILFSLCRKNNNCAEAKVLRLLRKIE